MNRVVAYKILSDRFHALEGRTEGLSEKLGHLPTESVLGEDGIEYTVDLEIRWDSKERGILSVFGTVRDNSWFKFSLLEEEIKIHLRAPRKTDP